MDAGRGFGGGRLSCHIRVKVKVTVVVHSQIRSSATGGVARPLGGEGGHMIGSAGSSATVLACSRPWVAALLHGPAL